MIPRSVAIEESVARPTPAPDSGEPDAPLETIVLRRPEELEDWRAEWLSLWRRCPSATPFQTPAWLVAWWRHLGDGELCTLALRRSGRLVALAPLYARGTPGSARRRFLLLGSGASDRLDLLAEPGDARSAAAAALAWLSEHESPETCELEELPPSSGWLLAPAPEGWTAESERMPEPSPRLALPTEPEGLEEKVPAHRLARLRQERRRAARAGALELRRAREHDVGEIGESFLRLHRARWRARGLPGVTSLPAVCAFLREALRELERMGALRLYALDLDRRTIGALLAFAAHGSVSFYLSGFDPRFAALSPGSLLVGHAIEESVREGAREFDFLRGAEPYKYRWGARDEWNHRRVFRRASAGEAREKE